MSGGSTSAGGFAADDMASQALIDSMALKTGEDAIAFFLKYGPTCPVKFVYGLRKYPPTGDIFKPYELVIVPFKECKDEYFTISASGE